MALTKSDKAEIKQMIQEALMEPQDTAVELPAWEPKVLKKSKMLGIEIASENYWEMDEDGDKKEYFTWDEAMEIEKKLPDGWRLPTRSEWVVLAEEFGVDDNGKLNGGKLFEELNLPLSGYFCDGSTHDQNSDGYYWSRSASSATGAYSLNFYSGSGGFTPQDNYYKWSGFAVRLVKDMEVKND